MMSLNQTYGNSKPVNAFPAQLQQSYLAALIKNNWPYYELNEQLRIDPGQWDLPGKICYDDKVRMCDQKVVSTAGLQFERWCQTKNVETLYTKIRAAPKGNSFPLLINVPSGFTYTQVETSRGNTYNVHHGIVAVLSLLSDCPAFKPSDIAVITPYLHQCAPGERLSASCLNLLGF